jgi:hypothetical protein
MLNEQLETIELSIEQAKGMIAKLEAAQRLITNKDFTLLVDEGYFRDEASRLVLLKSDPSMQGDNEQREIDNGILAIGGFRKYISTVFQMGNTAMRTLADDENTREDLLNEGI